MSTRQGRKGPHSGGKRAALRLLAAVTPLRSRLVRSTLIRTRFRFQRARRRRLERRGDSRLSRPALHGIDIRLAELLGEGGFFVEAGANDGYQQSNTYYLERFCGWKGVLVEPIPELCIEAEVERPDSKVVNAALVSPANAGGTIRMRFAGLMSMVAGSKGSPQADYEYIGRGLVLRPEQASYEVEVPARTLSEVLDEVGAEQIDLLSLDVEGFEAEVLAGLDLDRHAPAYLVIEVQDRKDGFSRIEAELEDRYQVVEELSEMDLLLRRRD